MTHCAIAQNGHNLQNESISQYLFDSTTQPLRLNPIDYEVSSRLRTQLWSRDRPGSMKQFETRAVQDMCAAAASSQQNPRGSDFPQYQPKCKSRFTIPCSLQIPPLNPLMSQHIRNFDPTVFNNPIGQMTR
jgi:hypothetical protein